MRFLRVYCYLFLALMLDYIFSVSSDELGAHVLELPYKGGDISLFVILPPFNKQRGISLLTKRLNTNILQEIVSSNEWRTRSVEVSLPKFSIEQTMDNLVPVSTMRFQTFMLLSLIASYLYICIKNSCWNKWASATFSKAMLICRR